MPTLRNIGFNGTIDAISDAVNKDEPWIWPEITSSAAMWTANAATICPSVDSSDGHVHFTPANLATYLHRTIEAETTSRVLKAIFPNPVFFSHHPPLVSGGIFEDEGAANQIRFSKTYQGPGIQLFVFGKEGHPEDPLFSFRPKQYPARQTVEASRAIARLHHLYPGHTVFAQQHPDTIDAGVFHNDLISTGNLNCVLIHEKAFLDQSQIMEELQRKVIDVCDTELAVIEVKENQVSLEQAVKSYLFNSQIVSLPDGSMSLIAPTICQHFESVMRFFKELLDRQDNPISTIHYVDLTQSMANGGGPACLRLRVILNDTELNEMNRSVLFTDRLYERLVEYVNRYYPTQLSLEDLGRPSLYQQNCEALRALTQILNIGNIYSFQT